MPLSVTVADGRATVPHHVEWEEQPILVIDERRFDFAFYRVTLAVELRALIGDLDRVAFLVFAFVREGVGLRVPFPTAGNGTAGTFRIESKTDPLDLPERIEAVGLGHLLRNRR